MVYLTKAPQRNGKGKFCMDPKEKNTKTVRLTHETVRLVDDSELQQIFGGGGTSNYCSSCTDSNHGTCCGTDDGGGRAQKY